MTTAGNDRKWAKADVACHACFSPKAQSHFLNVLPCAAHPMIDVGADLCTRSGERNKGKPPGANRASDGDRAATIDRLTYIAKRGALCFVPLCSNRFRGTAGFRISYLLWLQHLWWTLSIRQEDMGTAAYGYAAQAREETALPRQYIIHERVVRSQSAACRRK